MPTVMIADFSGMLPLRDGILLPDNNGQLANNCFLYRGQIRGFRSAEQVYTARYADTESIYRIPTNDNNPPDFTSAGSLWLEFPDPYMTAIRNPTVGDTFNRYYFFPSDKYAASGANPAWPVTSPGPSYNTLTRLQAGQPGYILGLPPPTTPPTVTPPPDTVVTTVSTALGPGNPYIFVASAANILVGMTVDDLTVTTVDAQIDNTAYGANPTPSGTSVMYFSSTTGIVAGMTVTDLSNPARINVGTTVANVSTNYIVMTTLTNLPTYTGVYIQFKTVDPVVPGTTVLGVTTGEVNISEALVGSGTLVGDTIEFASSLPETRAYGYTYVDDFDEESQISPVTVRTGDGTGTWIIVIPVQPSSAFAGRPFTPGTAHYRLYRTVTDSSGNATYFQVAEVPINFGATTTINDSALSADITGNLILSTIGYAPPPAGLQGVVMMANGIAAGFTNEREVWFSAAYLPYAWPAQYALTVDYPVVGLTANGTSLNIATEGSPFIATGVTPDTMTIGKITANEPCISRGSIISAGEGMYYASPNGIQLLNTGGTQNITLEIYEKEFHNFLSPIQWASGRYSSSYVAFIKGAALPSPDGGGYSGFVLDNSVPNVPFTYLRFPIDIVNNYSDELSGQLFALMSNGTVMQWNPPVGFPGTTTLRPWQWKSKMFRFTAPQQFKAFMVLFTVPPEVEFIPGTRNTDQSQMYDPTNQYLIVRVFANEQEVVVREVQISGEVLLIPGGFKEEIWEFQFEGIVAVRFFKVASSIKELKAT